MEQAAIRILNSNRIMAIATVRPDGWPQNTIVGYANEGWTVYFLIYRSSQKFANVEHDDRVSVAVGQEPRDLNELAAVYAAGHASEITEPEERERAWKLIMERHPVLAAFVMPKPSAAAMMRMTCNYVSVLDYTQGLGHTEELRMGGTDPRVPGDPAETNEEN